MTLFEQIKESAGIADLDEAIRPIQEILGQNDGGIASMFFSGPAGDFWVCGSEDWRRVTLKSYIEYELMMGLLA